jgi:hypothetical protein
MTKEELFKKNFPEYCTEKGVCLSPYYDVFEAGVEIATAELNKGIIQSLIKENAELKEKLKPENCLKLLAKDGYVKFTSDQLTEAKELIKNIINVTWGEGWSYSLEWKVKAERFLEATE